MRVLLDTHTFLWWVSDDRSLSRRARSIIATTNNECFLSIVSCWEMAIKVSLGKLSIADKLDRFLPEQMATNGFELLPIELDHVVHVAKLPFHHRDPFDRLLVAQALEEELTILSADSAFQRYGVTRIW